MDEDYDEPTQETAAGHTIPVPTREDVLRDLEKVAKPKPSQRSEDGTEPPS